MALSRVCRKPRRLLRAMTTMRIRGEARVRAFSLSFIAAKQQFTLLRRTSTISYRLQLSVSTYSSQTRLIE